MGSFMKMKCNAMIICCILGLVFTSLGIIFIIVGPVVKACWDCEEIFNENSWDSNPYQVGNVLAFYILTLVMAVVALSLFGILICSKCARSCGFMVVLVVFSSLAAAWALVLTAYFGAIFSPMYEPQFNFVIAMFVMGLLFLVAAQVMAIIAMSCKPQGKSGKKRRGKKGKGKKGKRRKR